MFNGDGAHLNFKEDEKIEVHADDIVHFLAIVLSAQPLGKFQG